MTATINNYMQDGACFQARVVLAFLSNFYVEPSYNTETKKYVDIFVAPWENRSGHGYVLSMTAKNGKQLNVAFFEADVFNEIHVVVWQQISVHSLTIDSARIDGQSYSEKVSHISDYGDVIGTSRFIKAQFTSFWNNNQ